jgi:hypothetical protein
MLVGFIVLWLWRDKTVRALLVTAFVFGTMSLGVPVYLHGHIVSPKGPWSIFNGLPLFTSVTPVRLGLIVGAVVGLLLAVALDRVLAANKGTSYEPGHPSSRRLWIAIFAAALVPLIPLPHYTVPAPSIPAFITQGTWRQYIDEDQTLVTVPLPLPLDAYPMQWAAFEHLDIKLAGGYFLGPIDGVVGRSARFGSTPRATDELFNKVVETGYVPSVTDRDREQAAADLAFWRAGAVVLDPNHKEASPLLVLATQLFGTPRFVGGVWLWDVG